jgi:uncharacterized membrane protein
MFYGLAKLTVAYGIWNRSWRLRRLMIIFFLCTTAVLAVEMALKLSWFKAVGLGVDAAFLYYLWRVLPRHLRHHDQLN